MNYELAKRLKEAGFPQEGERWLCSEGQPYPYARETMCNGESAYLPTLEELIEACGDGFSHLGKASSDIWGCWDNADIGGGNGYMGNSPSEAVASLWLALNQPVHNSTSTKDTK